MTIKDTETALSLIARHAHAVAVCNNYFVALLYSMYTHLLLLTVCDLFTLMKYTT